MILTFFLILNYVYSSEDTQAGTSDQERQIVNRALNILSLESGITVPHDTIDDQDSPFEKVHDNMYCSDDALLTSNNVNMRDCKKLCVDTEGCQYLAFWAKIKRCRLYMTCDFQTVDDKNKVSVYKRLSRCELQRDSYYRLIAGQFAPDILRPLYTPFEWQKTELPRSDYPNPNFYCKCTGVVWLTCAIFLSRDQEEYQTILGRFNTDDPEIIRPFRDLPNFAHKYGGERAYLAYSENFAAKKMLAEITFPQYVIDNSLTLPGCVHIGQCIAGTEGGMCPVQNRPFEVGEPVYILTYDVLFVQEGPSRKLTCISLKGLRSYIMRPEFDGGFKDPLGRTVPDRSTSPPGNKEFLTIDLDYKMFWLFDDVMLSTGICGEVVPQDARRAPPQSAASSSSAGPSSQVEPPPPPDSKSKKKKSRGGGKGKKQSSASSDPSLSAGSPVVVEPGSLPIFAESAPAPIPRSVSDTALLSSMSIPGSSSSGSPEFQSQQSGSLPEESAPTAARPKVVLSPREVEKLRRSFEAAKQRRARGGTPEQHVAVSHETKIQRSSIAWIALGILFLCVSIFIVDLSNTSEDKYIPLPEEI